MKNKVLLTAICILLSAAFGSETNAQILKKLEKKVKQKVDRRVDRKVDKKIDEGLDEVEGVGKDNKAGVGTIDKKANNEQSSTTYSGNEVFSYTSKYDFVPGNKMLLFEDFEKDQVGDLPAAWNTDGTAETVKLNNHPGKWILTKSGSIYIPDLATTLPDDFTFEFDVYASGTGRETSSAAVLNVYLSETNKLTLHDKNYSSFSIPFCQYIAVGMVARSIVGTEKDANARSVIKADIRKAALNKMHVAVAANKQRLRVWVNENKEIDIPRLMPHHGNLNYIKFHPQGFKDGKEDLFITNLRLAAGGQDLRSQLESTGKYATSGILFNTNSANILPESIGIMKELASVLNDNSSMKLKITGHTDSDGDANSNLELSKKRAAAVKTMLAKEFNVDEARLQTDGKGETIPVAENKSAVGKAQNRRVQFEKI